MGKMVSWSTSLEMAQDYLRCMMFCLSGNIFLRQVPRFDSIHPKLATKYPYSPTQPLSRGQADPQSWELACHQVIVICSISVPKDWWRQSGGMTTEKGAVINKPLGQKQNRRSSTNDKIYLADDLIGPILCTMCFIKSQCYNIDGNIMSKVIYATLFGWSRIGGPKAKINQSACVILCLWYNQ